MFDIGFLELLIIGVVGLLVLGPERLPKAARTAGLWVGKIKRTVSNMQREINSQLEAEELRQKLEEHQKKLDSSFDKTRKDVESFIEGSESSDANKTSARSASDTRAPKNIDAPLDRSIDKEEPEQITSGPTVSSPQDTANANDKDAKSR
ncbi:Sec-independent protein translocase protein TatB [Halomonas sp. PR-M31]|uniref:Sec-independent protein translocase protein TatB n=1 Tax=Halomonas sp. PR-M31 TaxID=1471202 RepID=UPI000651C1C7|nr:Sec-independent protein translocase protein TatB [Halomonas sp. PR-M31]